jgi:hypothetical protein
MKTLTHAKREEKCTAAQCCAKISSIVAGCHD